MGLLSNLYRSNSFRLDTLGVLREETGPGSTLTVGNTGCPDLRAGQMLRVSPVHVVCTVVVHVNQLVGQHPPHFLLSDGEVGADDQLVVSEVIPTNK